MLNAPYISIIIPIYNVQQYIGACLESIKIQTFTDFEVILVNDDSTDASIQIANQFANSNPQIDITILSLASNCGQSVARNVGIQNARGTYIYFLDSDDDIHPECLATLSSVARRTDADVIVGENYLISDTHREHIKICSKQDSIKSDIIESYCRREWYNQVWNKLFKRDLIILNNICFIEGVILEDELWSFEVAACAKHVHFVRKPLYNYYIRPKSTISSVKTSKRRWIAFHIINQQISEAVNKYNIAESPIVGKFLLENLLVTLTGFKQSGCLTLQRFNELLKLKSMSIRKLRSVGMISLKESIAYAYFDIPFPFSFIYYKIISIFIK